MSGRVPRAFIDDLLNRLDIIEVVDSRVPLKKKGKDYWACCPFHNEKSPSFSVSQNKQLYHCFGCKESGNAIGFLMDYDHMEFVEAIENLAHGLGLEVPYEKGAAPRPVTTDMEFLYDAMHQCNDFYQNQLKQNPTALSYLKQRGVSGHTAKNYAIGYAPSGWNSLSGSKKQLIEGGMLIEKDNGQSYDRFRHRLVFPIRDKRGRTIAFGGRVINPEDNPKYLNSPETTIFHKGKEIYGLFELRKAVTIIDQIFVTEGYMDVVALAEHEVKTAVATLGTAINNSQIETLFRNCNTLVFCFDGDEAGKKAAWRSLEACLISLKERRIARFLFMPDGHDPDTFIKEFGKDEFIEAANNAKTSVDYLFDELLATTDIASKDERGHFIDKLRPYIDQIPLQSMKDQILEEYENRTKTTLSPRILKSLNAHHPTPSFNQVIPENRWTPIKLAINLLLQKPQLGNQSGTQNHLADAGIPGVDLLLQLLDVIHEEPDISTQNLLDRFKGNDHESHLYQLAAVQPAMENEESIDLMFEDSMQALQNKYITQRRTQLIAKLQTGDILTDDERLEHKQLFTKSR
ncbi:MAG: DNA primase [Gammaproteobacteria bacterium]|nr:DNA primase [Gammaproteobacteria bacterium]